MVETCISDSLRLRLRQQHVDGASPPHHEACARDALERARHQHGLKMQGSGAHYRAGGEQQHATDQVVLVTDMPGKPDAHGTPKNSAEV